MVKSFIIFNELEHIFGLRMANNEKGKSYPVNRWVNSIILGIFLFVRFGVDLLLGWQIDATFYIVWITLFVAVSILVNYFLYLRWKKSGKTAYGT